MVLLVVLSVVWRKFKPAGMFVVAAIIVLELLRRDFFACIIHPDRAHANVSLFLGACDILGAVILIIGYWLGVVATIAYHIVLSVWSQTLHIPGIAEYPWERPGQMTFEEEGPIMARRRQLHNIGATVRRRLIWSSWLILFVAWTSDLMHPRRLLTPYYMGPWNAGVFLVPINQLLKCGWRKIIIHVLARDSFDYDLLWVSEPHNMELPPSPP
ncbi:hypothetical protein B0H13DRAFT_1855609 [Mycena leptocephala]|nr:hypothetical protein B0H13DRAFT_1855609 [Mycena leptocephala]